MKLSYWGERQHLMWSVVLNTETNTRENSSLKSLSRLKRWGGGYSTTACVVCNMDSIAAMENHFDVSTFHTSCSVHGMRCLHWLCNNKQHGALVMQKWVSGSITPPAEHTKQVSTRGELKAKRETVHHMAHPKWTDIKLGHKILMCEF